MKEFLKLINVRDFITSVAASIVILTIVACGSGHMGIPNIPGIPSVAKFVRVHSSLAGAHIYPPNSSGQPFVAALFQASSPTPSQLQQSFDAGCNFSNNPTVATFLDSAPQGQLMPISFAGEVQLNTPAAANLCASITDQTGIPTINATFPGKETFFDGNLTSLVVTGKTFSGASFECRDITTTFAVPDKSHTRAWLDPNAHTIVIFNDNGTTLSQVPFVCSGIGTHGDQPMVFEIQFAKI